VVVFLLVEALLFGLFTLCMMFDQYSVVASHQTKIDRLKGHKHEAVEDFNEVFGSSNKVRFSWEWLFPKPVEFPEDCRAQIFGYILPGCGWNCHPTRVGLDAHQEAVPFIESVTARWTAGALSGVKEAAVAEEEDAGLLSQVRHRGQTSNGGGVFFQSPTPPPSSDDTESRPHSK
jgi:hypothetical protein